MSVQTEIDRISNNVQSTLSTIASTGVDVPSGANSNDLPSLVSELATTKQDVLTGAKGKFVGFGDTGLAEAQRLSDITIYDGTSTNGIIYTVTVPWITELVVGQAFVMVPKITSTATSVKINVSGTGEVSLRQPLTTNSSATAAGYSASWLVANKPVLVTYNGTYWVTTSLPRPDANTIYGAVPIESGGTDATTAAAALTNLGGMPLKTSGVSITGNTTLGASHAEKMLLVDSSSAVTITVPSGTAIPDGTLINIVAVGTGAVTFVAESGVTLKTKDGKRTIDGQYAAVTLYKESTNTWYGWGALA